MVEIRKIWSENSAGDADDACGGSFRWQGRWNFVMVDVVENIVETERPDKYWYDFKRRLKSGDRSSGDVLFQLSEKIGKLKTGARDGKSYPTDVANLETTLRLINLLSNKTTTSPKSHTMAGYCRNFVIKESQKPSPTLSPRQAVRMPAEPDLKK